MGSLHTDAAEGRVKGEAVPLGQGGGGDGQEQASLCYWQLLHMPQDPLPGPLGDLDISRIDALPLCSDSKTSASSSPVARSLTLQLLLEPMLRNSLET